MHDEARMIPAAAETKTEAPKALRQSLDFHVTVLGELADRLEKIHGQLVRIEYADATPDVPLPAAPVGPPPVETSVDVLSMVIGRLQATLGEIEAAL